MKKKCLVVLGGTVNGQLLKDLYNTRDDIMVIAADKGLEALYTAGIMPDKALGDFDSVDHSILEKYSDTDKDIFSPVKDFTDGEAAVELAVKIVRGMDASYSGKGTAGEADCGVEAADAAGNSVEAADTSGSRAASDAEEGIASKDIMVRRYAGYFFDPEEISVQNDVIILGASGTRLDHTMANISLLKKTCDAGVKAVIINERNIIRVCSPGRISVKRREVKSFLSLMPLGDKVSGIELKGFKYEGSDLSLYQGSSLGISNEITDITGEISHKEGYLLVMETID